MAEEDVWRLTPKKYGALVRMKKAMERRQDWRAALCAWASIKAMGGKDWNGRIEDFIPREEVRKQGPSRQQSATEMLQVVELIVAANGGKDLRGHG